MNKARQNPMEQRAHFFVNEKLALELVITVCFQQVKKIIRSERKQLVRDQYLHAEKRDFFYQDTLITGLTTLLSLPLLSPSSRVKYYIDALCFISKLSVHISATVYFLWKNFKVPSGFKSSLCISCTFPVTRNSG